MEQYFKARMIKFNEEIQYCINRFMGCGKTTIENLAILLTYPFIDSDKEIESKKENQFQLFLLMLAKVIFEK